MKQCVAIFLVILLVLPLFGFTFTEEPDDDQRPSLADYLAEEGTEKYCSNRINESTLWSIGTPPDIVYYSFDGSHALTVPSTLSMYTFEEEIDYFEEESGLLLISYNSRILIASLRLELDGLYDLISTGMLTDLLNDQIFDYLELRTTGQGMHLETTMFKDAYQIPAFALFDGDYYQCALTWLRTDHALFGIVTGNAYVLPQEQQLALDNLALSLREL